MAGGTRLGCDVGTVRIGLARCDPEGVLATALPAVQAGPQAITEVVCLVADLQAVEVIVGLPLRLDGTVGPAAEQAQAWAAELRKGLKDAGQVVQVHLRDERLTTVQAQRGLHAAGRTTRSSRQRIDSASAVVLLQGYLDQQRRNQTGGT